MGVGRFTGLVETCVVCAALQLLRGLKSSRERGGLGRAGPRLRVLVVCGRACRVRARGRRRDAGRLRAVAAWCCVRAHGLNLKLPQRWADGLLVFG